jgi:competence protein ComEC
MQANSQLACMSKFHIPFWKDAPFIRIIIPFIAGIAISYYADINEKISFAFSLVSVTALICYSCFKIEWKFRFRYLSGLFLNMLILSTGAFFAALKNPYKNNKLSLPTDGYYIITLKEPLTQKKSSWKALCTLESIQTRHSTYKTQTGLLLYIKKDSTAMLPSYGDRIALRKTPERIKNFIQGSSFDYQRYCALKNIHYQVFVKPSDIIYLNGTFKNPVNEFLFRSQDWIVSVLRRYIKGDKECGLAEALLIGYKNDLDRNLIQSYSNTGVVHVVAISGLHLGLVYSILNMLCRPLSRKLLRPVIILTGLWLFSLLAGASPSVLRSAVMFSSIVIGETVARKSSVINNLSVSAFFLLCYDPYWLWDLGFILSYSALLSIVLFMKPLYNSYVSENKLIDIVWKLNAVTISAQILTLPVLLFSFGQFPNLFMITNFMAIPISSIILIGEIILCVTYFIEPVAIFCGYVLSKLIKFMNTIVEYIDQLPYSSTKNVHMNMLQVALLYVFIAFAYQWFAGKHKSWQ